MNLVVDASVALKWFFRFRDDETQVDCALDLLSSLDTGGHEMVQPPHFLAEVGAVLARKKPAQAQTDLADLARIDWRFTREPGVYAMAIELSTQLGHHLFDTLYHAVALCDENAVLVTADRVYYDKGRTFGRIMRLRNFKG